MVDFVAGQPESVALWWVTIVADFDPPLQRAQVMDGIR